METQPWPCEAGVPPRWRDFPLPIIFILFIFPTDVFEKCPHIDVENERGLDLFL